MSALFDAAGRGSVEDVLRLLADGADPDSPGLDGNTPLHEAVRQERALVAAVLLANGADWTIRNAAGNAALSTEFTTLETLHRIRQEYQRLPVAAVDGAASEREDVASYVHQLERDGVLKVSGLVPSDVLRRMQSDLAALVTRLRFARMLPWKRLRHYDQEEYWHPGHRSYVTNDALRTSADLLALCCSPVVIETANHYLHKPGHIKRVSAMRYLSSGPIHTQQFGWHHDMEERQLKLMLLLTDVGEEDQYMSYVRGSHRAFHPYPRFLKNALDFDYCRSYLDEIDIVNTTGRAGDVFFFDSNGMHRGNRSRGRVRDAFFVEFTADRNRSNLWGTSIPRDRVPSTARSPTHPLGQLLEATPKWKRVRNQPPRRRSSWAKSLEDPSAWI